MPSTPIERASDFQSIVEMIRHFYEAVRDDANHYAMSLPIWEAGCPELLKSNALPPVPQPNPKPSVSFSRMGNIDEILASKGVQSVVGKPWVTGEELGSGLGLILGTFRGKMSLSDAWYGVRWSRISIEIQVGGVLSANKL